MIRKIAALASPIALLAALTGTAHAEITAGKVVRTAPDAVVVSWTDSHPVDVYVAESADGGLAKAKLVSDDNMTGTAQIPTSPGHRPYILLKDAKDGSVVHLAERVVPLEQGSNFRDIGGYPAAGGKHVRWGRIYRSGATPLLTEADIASLKALGLKEMIDLRSSEERVMAPTRLDGVRYSAVGYSMSSVLPQASAPTAPTGGLYGALPALLAPQLRILFASLLRDEGPVVYNCSAGQDRTGFATALVLTALGVPQDVILQDYHLSTATRRPQWEMPRLDAAAHPNNPVAAYFATLQKDPKGQSPKPLYDAEHHPLLDSAFAEIDRRWGSVDAYLDKELGVTAADVAKLRRMYLE